MRERILAEVRRIAEASDGKVPGARAFEQATGIRESAWRGIHWARWSDAIAEAGLTPNGTSEMRRIPDDEMLSQLAEACREFGRMPTVAEMRMYGRTHPAFPNAKTIERRFGSFTNLGAKVGEWSRQSEIFKDVATILGMDGPATILSSKGRSADGSVYLIQSGAFFKIGRSEDLERRVREIRIALPDKAKFVHAIGTDDPSGIEAYWHRRFADKRANGEWFKLDVSDVAAFKRRKFQ